MIKIILLLICKHLTSHFYNTLTTNEEPKLSLSQQNFYLKKNIYIEYNNIDRIYFDQKYFKKKKN
jgi:hypothetical protein